ncbi:hypothetical protein R3P38DRAFT_2807749 [Favolaschia claudopus]|uniref:Uncharacterized protein n=1 Tax=Favolaschia claudopus TaxID=2862362 RepID=A0AAV9ZI48_9AGAR
MASMALLTAKERHGGDDVEAVWGGGCGDWVLEWKRARVFWSIEASVDNGGTVDDGDRRRRREPVSERGGRRDGAEASFGEVDEMVPGWIRRGRGYDSKKLFFWPSAPETTSARSTTAAETVMERGGPRGDAGAVDDGDANRSSSAEDARAMLTRHLGRWMNGVQVKKIDFLSKEPRDGVGAVDDDNARPSSSAEGAGAMPTHPLGRWTKGVGDGLTERTGTSSKNRFFEKRPRDGVGVVERTDSNPSSSADGAGAMPTHHLGRWTKGVSAGLKERRGTSKKIDFFEQRAPRRHHAVDNGDAIPSSSAEGVGAMPIHHLERWMKCLGAGMEEGAGCLGKRPRGDVGAVDDGDANPSSGAEGRKTMLRRHLDR